MEEQVEKIRMEETKELSSIGAAMTGALMIGCWFGIGATLPSAVKTVNSLEELISRKC